MARNTITVTFTADAIADADSVRRALQGAAQEYTARQADVRDITVVSLTPVAEPVTVAPDEYARFVAWRAQQDNATA